MRKEIIRVMISPITRDLSYTRPFTQFVNSPLRRRSINSPTCIN